MAWHPKRWRKMAELEHLKDIHFDTSRTEDVSLLINANMPELHLLNEIQTREIQTN